TGEPLAFVSVAELLEVGEFLVAAGAAAGEANEDRALVAKLGQVDDLTGGVLDLEVRGLLADGDLGARHRRGVGGFEGGGQNGQHQGSGKKAGHWEASFEEGAAGLPTRSTSEGA